ncbi:MAG TPA: protein-L-isoaspartate O-methyltransferase [Nitrososphaerales archaeon]|nr:protein-L-isoaspartate O-methyltransferase [Nitrososphaerales archaeon]
MSSNNLSEFLKESKLSLIRSLKDEGILRSKSIEEALLAVPREEFIWPGTTVSISYQDEPILLDETGQTISAPHMIVMMLEEFDLSSGLKVLEIGSGSGYNAALISHIVSRGTPKNSNPLVVSVERDPSLVAFARKNIERANLSGYCKVVEGDGSLGYPQESSDELYDRIMVTAGAPHIPVFLKKQLKVGGILEVPVGGSSYQKLMVLRKISNTEFEQRKLVDCMFVPLIGSDAHSY